MVCDLAHVTKALDTRYQPAVHGPPSKLVNNPNTVQNLLVLQDNAKKFAHNDTLTRRRKGDLERLGGYRDPISNGQRSFKASYGPVRELGAVLPGTLKVRDTEGNESLLKLVKAVPKGSGEAVASMTRKTEPVKRKAPVAGGGVPAAVGILPMGTPLPATGALRFTDSAFFVMLATASPEPFGTAFTSLSKLSFPSVSRTLRAPGSTASSSCTGP